MQTDHSKILTATAREVLEPLGLVQRGRSRIWIADHGWWIAVVEFQPSAWSRGSYLNVGAMWLTYPSDSIAFHVGHRQHAFESFETVEQFGQVASALARLAAEMVEELRSRLRTFTDAYKCQAEILADQHPRQRWSLYHTAAFAMLAGDLGHATFLAHEIANKEAIHEWQNELKRISAATFSAPSPAAMIEAHTIATRRNLKMRNPQATGFHSAA